MVGFRKENSGKGRGRQRPGAGFKRPAYSYYAADTTKTEGQGRREGPSVSKAGRWKQRLRSIPTIIAALTILAAIVYSTTLTTTPRVHFAGPASPYRSTGDYQAIMGKYSSQSLLNRSKLTVDAGKLEAYALATFPEIDAARIVLPIMGRRPALTLHIRTPALLLTTKTSALVLDSSGKAVSDTKQLASSAVAGLLTVQDESGLEVHAGDQAVTSETVSFIDNARRQLSDKSLTVDRLVLPTIANEVDIYIKGLPYRIKADVSGDARLQIGAFLATRESGVNPSEYMDVRVEEKVFYK